MHALPSTRGAWRATLTALLLGVTMHAAAQVTDESPWAALQNGSIVLFRHADAPGIGDPAGFRLGDCGTQRNLSEAGRDQARRIGERFRSRAVKVGAVLSSQWCRTRDTAELAFPGMARDDPGFNSTFGDRSSTAGQTGAALATLKRWRGPGALVVVTHQVNITALTGRATASGEGIVVRPRGDGIEALASLPPRGYAARRDRKALAKAAGAKAPRWLGSASAAELPGGAAEPYDRPEGNIALSTPLSLRRLLALALLALPLFAPTAAQAQWQRCAGQDEVCRFDGPALVRYGAEGRYAYRVARNRVVCDQNEFGDPAAAGSTAPAKAESATSAARVRFVTASTASSSCAALSTACRAA